MKNDTLKSEQATTQEQDTGFKLHPHQQAVADELNRLSDKTILYSQRYGTTVTGRINAVSRVDTAERKQAFDAHYGGYTEEMLVIDHKLRGEVGKGVGRLFGEHDIHDEAHDVAEAESSATQQPKKRASVSSLTTALMVAASLAPRSLFDAGNPFAALERRTLSPEEAREAFKTSDADKARAEAAEAKRARKAAKLKGLGKS